MKLKEFIDDGGYLLNDYYDGLNDWPLPEVAFVDDGGDVTAHVDWYEPLAWHVEHWTNLMNALGLADPEMIHVTARLSDAIAQVFEEESPELAPFTIDDATGLMPDDEHGALTFSIELPKRALELDVDSEEFIDLVHPFLATCQNLTDPGTFGSVYLFAEVARKLNIDWTDEVREAGGLRGVIV